MKRKIADLFRYSVLARLRSEGEKAKWHFQAEDKTLDQAMDEVARMSELFETRVVANVPFTTRRECTPAISHTLDREVEI